MTEFRDVFLMDPLALGMLVVVAVVLTAAAGQAVVFRLPPFRGTAARPVAAPFFVSVTTIFALFLAFLAADAWSRNSTATHARQSETTAIERIAYVSTGLGAEAAPILAALRTYVRTTVDGEWRATQNRRSDPAALGALGALEQTIVRLNSDCRGGVRPPPCVGDAIADSLLRATEDLHDGRTVRLATASNFGNPVRWSMLMAMALVSFVAVALIHADRPLNATVGSILVGTNVALAIALIALYEFPYAGLDAVDPEPLLAAIGAR